MNKRILFIAPHPDDETLGCGGAIQRHLEDGDTIYWLIITKAYEEDGFSKEKIDRRENEIIAVQQEYKFDGVYRLNLRTVCLDTYPTKDVVAAIGSVIQESRSNVLYIPCGTDVHSDHHVVFNASWSCCKSFRYPEVKEVYVYETLSETEFSAPFSSNSFMPNTFMDITPYLEKKNRIMELYASEVNSHPFPRSVKNMTALATLRGAQMGVSYAEAFVCLKRIIP
ncbi:MAG: PIG-L family deacetylase [Rhodothermaceae bacterium]|nr:PIG-L family deacetylase [Rhodothermaceae bacterium]